MTDPSNNLCGGISELAGEDLQQALELLNKSLATLANGDGPSFQVVKVKSATAQVVAGRLYHFEVQLAQGDVIKEGSVKIWSQPWLKENGTNITIKCEGDDNVIESTF